MFDSITGFAAWYVALAETNTILFFMIFIVFIIAAFILFKFLFKILMVGLIAGMFPVFMNFLGFNIPLDLYSIFWFVITGIGLYIVYLIVKLGWKGFKLAASPFRSKK